MSKKKKDKEEAIQLFEGVNPKVFIHTPRGNGLELNKQKKKNENDER